jgi:hypothetical protein
MIDPSRARRIFAGAAASVFAVAAVAGMAAGVTAGVTAVSAAGGTVARPAATGLDIRSDASITRCFVAGPVKAAASWSASSHHTSYALTAARQPQARPRCF